MTGSELPFTFPDGRRQPCKTVDLGSVREEPDDIAQFVDAVDLRARLTKRPSLRGTRSVELGKLTAVTDESVYAAFGVRERPDDFASVIATKR